MEVGDAHMFPGFLTPVLTHHFFTKQLTTFLTCFCRSEKRNYAGEKLRLNRVSNSQAPGHESDTLTTEPPGRGSRHFRALAKYWLNSESTENVNCRRDMPEIMMKAA